MKAIIKYFQVLLNNNEFASKNEFNQANTLLSLERYRIISFILLALSICYFYIDFVLLISVRQQMFWKVLVSIHIITLFMALVYLLLYKYLVRICCHSILPKVVLRSYVILGLFLASAISINSQSLTMNIHVYIWIVLLTAFIYPFEPKFIFIALIVNHVFFMVGLSFTSIDGYQKLGNQINSTFVVICAIFMSIVLHKFRVFELTNEYKLKMSESNLRKIFNINPFPLLISRFSSGEILYTNERTPKFYEISEVKLKEMNILDLHVNKRDWEQIVHELQQNGKANNKIIEHQIGLGSKKWVVANYEIFDYNGEKSILTGVTDITEIKNLEKELAVHATTDALTGILNRRKGMELFKNMLRDSQISRESLVVCFADIDELKSVNDKYGHSEGDFLISTICNAISKELKAEDIFFRYGGDEFIIVFRNKYLQTVENLCKNIKEVLLESSLQNDRPYILGVSFGLYQYCGEHDITVNEAIEAADKNMYQEKQGRIEEQD